MFLDFMAAHGQEAVHDKGELNVVIDIEAKLKVQQRIQALKDTEKEVYDKNKIKGIDLGEFSGFDYKNMLYDPALLDWEGLSEAEKNRLRKLYPHLFEDGKFIGVQDWMKFGPRDAKYGPYGIIEEDSDELSSLLSDEEFYIDPITGKRAKRKKRGDGDSAEDDEADKKNLRLDEVNRLEDMRNAKSTSGF